MLVDKYEAKRLVADTIGESHIIPTLGVWDKFDDIDFSILPNQFVLKCTHDSGGLIICRDKKKFNKKSAKKKIEKCLKHNFYYGQREWEYKNIKPRIIAEEYMEDETAKQLGSSGLTDYKIFCFNGKPEFIYVFCGLENHETAQMGFLTMEWEFADFKRSDYQSLTALPDKPKRFDEMIEYARKLSKNEKFVRIDFYEINTRVYFSEVTYYPCSGYMPFDPIEWDNKIGRMLKL